MVRHCILLFINLLSHALNGDMNMKHKIPIFCIGVFIMTSVRLFAEDAIVKAAIDKEEVQETDSATVIFGENTFTIFTD